MFDKIKKYLNRDYNDYSTGNVDPRDFHKMLFMFLKLFCVLDEPSPGLLYISLFVISIFATTTTILLCFSIYHGIAASDLSFFAESFTYFMVNTYQVFILSTLKLNVKDIQVLVHHLELDFKYACNKGGKYRERFFKNQIQTLKFSTSTNILISITATAMVIFTVLSLMFYLATHTSDARSERPLLFPIFLFGVDTAASPTYEFFFVYTNVCVILYSYVYIYMIQMNIVWIREITTKVDIIILCLQALMDAVRPATTYEEKIYYDGLIKYRMREIIQLHQQTNILTKHYTHVYKKLLMFEQSALAPVVCLCSFTTARKWETGEINIILALLCFAAIVLLFIPSYLCTFLSYKVKSISQACYDTPFWNASSIIKPYLVLISQRSMVELPLSAPGFEEVSLQTFANKMASAYSYFNMLNQVAT